MTTELLIISRNFPPLIGGMEKLVWQAFRGLASEYRCTVIGPRGCSQHVPLPHRAIECDESSVARFMWQAARAALASSRKTDYALAVAGSGVTAPLCRLLHARREIPSLVFLHGLDIVVTSRLYRLLWMPRLRSCEYVVANSRNTARLAALHGIYPNEIRIINPGVDVPDNPPNDSGRTAEFPPTRGPLLLSLGRIVRRKGLLEFIEGCMPQLRQAHPELRLLVIGEEPTSALKRDSGVVAAIESAIARLDLADAVILHGRGSDADVESALAAADLFVFPLIEVEGDVEGFGMVALEAAALGTPTVAFDCGGVGDAVLHGKTGFLVEAGDYNKLTEEISGALANDAKKSMQGSCREFARSKDWAHFGNELRDFVATALRNGQ